ncbi:hypothetical protein F6S87_07385 [Bifidobacterium sp. BRDM6]|uniref:DNA polymerase III subunit epsilon n=1 Tax=Bifidobacterium choloepi TaxID=2614131 RepID=A0A6I5N0I3_9BIFI|nr:hypothetical protein [Bifidobacterium choloepi]
MPWQREALGDIVQWASQMTRDADGKVIDWDWIGGLDLAGGIGVGSALLAEAVNDSGTIRAGESSGNNGTIPPTEADTHRALAEDLRIRTRVEAVLELCTQVFMCDFDRAIHSYRLPRALAYANRRLNDEIGMLVRLGEREGRWTAHSERRGFTTVTVLDPAGETELDDVQDRSDVVAEQRKRNRRHDRDRQRRSQRAWERGSVQHVTAASHSEETAGTLTGATTGAASGSGVPKPQPKSDDAWRRQYLPGRDVGTVLGIDIETTGVSQFRDYVIDIGFETMDMASPVGSGPDGEPAAIYGASGHAADDFADGDYGPSDAYDQRRNMFGVPAGAAWLGNPFIRRLTGLDVSAMGPAAWTTADDRRRTGVLKPFDDYPAAQRGLLDRLTAMPYVAHNATFEHKYFLANIEGYAEAYRDGRVTILDTLPMSRFWDPGAVRSDEHPYGDNTLQAYARRQGALGAAAGEQHRGLEDAHIMLVAMKNQLAWLRDHGQGPWGPDGQAGVGGKHTRRGW